MKELTGSQLRKLFLDFFEEKGHEVYPSKSLVPVDDPTLLWINSGVATLKKYFDGREVPKNPRITNSQKSIRTNDIENVGKTARHHTFFEMLGNFSIGDYFKEEAIVYAWEFLTSPKWVGFDPNKLYITVYPQDEEAYNIWTKKVGIPEDHMVRFEKNYWEIGEGPAGPNTEIFYDRGKEYEFDTPKEELFAGGENERYLEVWNLVFSQYNANPELSREEYPELPSKNIDTGMGLERMLSVIQDAPTNYDTDLFLPIIKKVEEISGHKYLNSRQENEAFRVIADHIRTATFAICDGALPANEGRGYVIRRLIRRAVKFARILDINRPFMKELVPVVVEIMKDFYTELELKIDLVSKVIESEEVRFFNTLNDGLNILNEVIKKSETNIIDGQTAFKLYDTYGFPIELTEEYALEAKFKVDIDAFKMLLEEQRNRARAAREEVDSMQTQNELLLNLKVESKFIGYNNLEKTSNVVTIINENELVEKATVNNIVTLVVEETPFYAESGGQVSDKGIIKSNNFEGIVTEVKKAPNGQHIHIVTINQGELNLNDEVELLVNNEFRNRVMKNHTATHLLHKALKQVLGEHVNQAGSLVTDDKLRFDFTHMSALKEEELSEIENIVNNNVWNNLKVTMNEMPIADARALGATALFGEKYGDVVRVVQAGDFSIELCGGTHVENTSSIGLFKVLTETGIGAGIRRIEAVTAEHAFKAMNSYKEKIDEIRSFVKAKENDVVSRVHNLVVELKEAQRTNESLNSKLSNYKTKELINNVEEINGFNTLRAFIPNTDINNLRTIVDDFKANQKSGIIVLASNNDDKVTIIAGVTEDYIKKGAHAGKIVKELAAICHGGGGGRPDLAQAGGKDTSKINDAISHVETIVSGL